MVKTKETIAEGKSFYWNRYVLHHGFGVFVEYLWHLIYIFKKSVRMNKMKREYSFVKSSFDMACHEMLR